jgi:ATP-dependent exoDNAse (exonuclease V) beta subunit
VASEDEPLFDEAMNALGNQYEGILSFRYIGPLPAYSFVNIELNQGNFALLDKARKTLQLPEKATWEQIKTAYRTLILMHHPDRNPDSPEAAQRCKEVLAAYDMVNAYCQSFQSVGERSQQGEFSFVQAEVEKVFIADHKGALLT